MKYDKSIKIKDHTDELEKIYKQRQYWLFASSIVFTSVIIIIFCWDYIDSYENKKIWWVIVSLGLLISVNWWYWTMKSMAVLVKSIYAEYNLLNEINTDIKELKEFIRKEYKD